MQAFFIALLHVHFHIWWHECLSNRSIAKSFPKSNAVTLVETASTFKECFILMTSENALHVHCMVTFGLNVNTATHCWALKTLSVGVWIQSHHSRNYVKYKIQPPCLKGDPYHFGLPFQCCSRNIVAYELDIIYNTLPFSVLDKVQKRTRNLL